SRTWFFGFRRSISPIPRIVTTIVFSSAVWKVWSRSMSGTLRNSSASESLPSLPRPAAVICRWKEPTEPSARVWRPLTNSADSCRSSPARSGNWSREFAAPGWPPGGEERVGSPTEQLGLGAQRLVEQDPGCLFTTPFTDTTDPAAAPEALRTGRVLDDSVERDVLADDDLPIQVLLSLALSVPPWGPRSSTTGSVLEELPQVPGVAGSFVQAIVPRRFAAISTLIRVLFVDDDDLMRAGLHAVLSSDEAIEVVGEAA